MVVSNKGFQSRSRYCRYWYRSSCGSDLMIVIRGYLGSPYLEP